MTNVIRAIEVQKVRLIERKGKEERNQIYIYI